MRKIMLSLVVLLMVAFESSAFKIIIRGGSKNQTYYTVIVTPRKIECTGTGNTTCPVGWMSASGPMNRWHQLQDVTDYVLDQVAKGVLNGETTFEEDLPVSWVLNDQKNVEIEIQETEMKGLKDEEKE